MKISGLQKLTLLDYPGKIACTVFLQGCNFRCPFCHNASLVIRDEQQYIEKEEFFSFLKKRQGLVEGVCVTGGEPLMSEQTLDFLRQIKSLGYCVKLDTNGYNPDLLRKVTEEKIADYIAMDIKNCLDKYAQTVGKENFDTEKIRCSIELIKDSGIDYEFRTTVVKQLHTEEDLFACADLAGKQSKYFLQQFKDSGDLISENLCGYTNEELRQICESIKQKGYNVTVRGV